MSVGGPSPLGTLMVQRVEAALGVTLAQQANVATGARPDAVTQPGQPDKVDPAKNPPPKEHEGARRPNEQGSRQAGLAALARNDPEIAKLLAARNAPMTSYTASAPTTLGQAAKTILALLQQFPEARPAVTGRAPLLGQAPGQGGAGAGTAGSSGALAGGTGAGGQPAATPVGGNLDPRAVEALMQRTEGGGNQASSQAGTSSGAQATGTAANANAPQAAGSHARSVASAQPAGAAAPNAAQPGSGLPSPTGMAGQLAHALSQALQSSGLFYESHLRDLAFGRRDAAQLRGEPQAQAGQQASPSVAGESAQGRPGAEAASGQASQQTGQAHANQGASAQAAASHAASAQAGQASAHLAGALLGLDPATHVLVRQQLETLANQSLAWLGEAWPGTDMEWEVQRREPGDGEADQPDTWATRLKLNLPGLGEVQARLSLSGTQLVMHLVSPQGADVMADHTDTLRQRLNLQGLLLSQLTISRELEGSAGAGS